MLKKRKFIILTIGPTFDTLISRSFVTQLSGKSLNLKSLQELVKEESILSVNLMTGRLCPSHLKFRSQKNECPTICQRQTSRRAAASCKQILNRIVSSDRNEFCIFILFGNDSDWILKKLRNWSLPTINQTQ